MYLHALHGELLFSLLDKIGLTSQRLPVPAPGEGVPATLVERVRIGPMIAGSDDQLSRTALHELRFGRLHEHSADATPVMARRDSQCHDLAVLPIGFGTAARRGFR